MKNSASGDLKIDVSVIIPCYNSQRTIRQCLDSILNQTTDASYDVTVVDSSTDDTPNIVAREYPSVRLIHKDGQTFAGTARNIGIAETAGSYCLMIDSDCIAAPNLVASIVRRHKELGLAGVGGAICNGTPRSWSGLLCYLLEFKEYLPSTPNRYVQMIPTANVAYRREVFETYGGFDDSMQFSEDILFSWNLTSAGEQILFEPCARVTHLNRTGWRTVLSYQWGLGKMSARARKRGGLPGQIVLRHPILIFLLPFARLYRAFRWLGKYDRPLLARLIFLSGA
ncbi:MAG TPA: glycosyltransferase, partial [Blastocatellia bacterium]|nr:glycosyltransferase [Blastocatellia bacterium]